MSRLMWNLAGAAGIALVAALVVGFLPAAPCGSYFVRQTDMVTSDLYGTYDACAGQAGYAVLFWVLIAGAAGLAIAAYVAHQARAHRRESAAKR